jgi:AraC-like DNA-binding protein
MFLIGPFLYFYVRNTLTYRHSLSKKDWLHFIPTSIAFIGSIPYLLQPFEKKLQIADSIIKNPDMIKVVDVSVFYTMGQSFVLRCIIAFLYLIVCVYLLWKLYPSSLREKQITENQLIITYRWLIILIINLLFIFVSFILLAINSADTVPSETIKDGQLIYIIAGLFYSIMSFSLILFPEILYGIPRQNEVLIHKKEKVNNKIPEIEDRFHEIHNAILKYLEEEKPYLNADFSVSDIALYIKVPQNKVSYCIRHLMETKFSKLKSELRIKYALELLKNGSNSLITIEAIGKQSGFKTRSHFYSAFKEETGFTPSEYTEQLNK